MRKSAPEASSNVCTGKPDGTACSDVFPNAAHECIGGQLVETLTCPAPLTRCIGVGAERTILCDDR